MLFDESYREIGQQVIKTGLKRMYELLNYIKVLERHVKKANCEVEDEVDA